MEVISPAMTIKVVGFLRDGPKSYIFKTITKIKVIFLYQIKKVYKIFSANNLNFNNIIKLISLLFNIGNHNQYFYLKPTLTILSKFITKNNGVYLMKRSFHSRCRAINRIGPHNKDVISVLIGLMLGDGYANNRTGEGVRFSIKQSIIHKDYLFSLYEFFVTKGYCSNLKPREYKRTIKGINKIYYGYEFNTYTFRSFLWLYNSFYKNGTKIIPLDIEKYITPLTLAI